MLVGAWRTLLGGLAMIWSVIRTRGGWGSPYWRWRWQTAFGRGAPPRGELLLGLAHYARWVASMRRYR